MSECEEVALSLYPSAPHGATFPQYEKWVRQHMPDESEVVVSNVAWALLELQP